MKDTAHYKELLETEKSKLEGELKTVGRKNPSNPGDWEAVPQETAPEADPADVAVNIEGYEENAVILNDLELRYADVKDALERIEKGTYGICEVSGEPIEEDRLNADPAARTCKVHMNVTGA